MSLAIGVDVGGTKIAAGLVDEDGRVTATTRRDTPSTDPDKIEEAITDVVRDLADDRDVEAVGLAAAGLVDAERSTVLFAPNLARRREPLREKVEKRCGLPGGGEPASRGARSSRSAGGCRWWWRTMRTLPRGGRPASVQAGASRSS